LRCETAWIEGINDTTGDIRQARQRHQAGRGERSHARIIDAHGTDSVVAEVNAIDFRIVFGRDDRDGVLTGQRQ